MTRRLLIHPGLPKCGSTYLQKVLVQNRKALLAQGVNYPGGGRNHPGAGADLSTWGAADLEPLFAKADTVILSHEDLIARAGQMKPVAGALAQMGVTVEVLVFLRPMAEVIYGDYSQFIKQNIGAYLKTRKAFEGRTLEQFASDRQRVLTVPGFLRQWQTAFAGSPLHLSNHRQIRPVIEELTGATDLNWDIPRAETNPSLRMADCEEIALAINTPDIPETVVRDMYALALQKVSMPDPGKTPERARWINAMFRHQMMVLTKEFGYAG